MAFGCKRQPNKTCRHIPRRNFATNSLAWICKSNQNKMVRYILYLYNLVIVYFSSLNTSVVWLLYLERPSTRYIITAFKLLRIELWQSKVSIAFVHVLMQLFVKSIAFHCITFCLEFLYTIVHTAKQLQFWRIDGPQLWIVQLQLEFQL